MIMGNTIFNNIYYKIMSLTQYEKEKRKIKRTYMLIMGLLLMLWVLVTALGGIWVGAWALLFPLGPIMGLLTIVFYISYNNPSEWGWLMFGRRRMVMGSPWESRVRRDMAAYDARKTAEEHHEYISKVEHKRSAELTDLRKAREQIKERHVVRTKTKDSNELERYGEGVRFCPSCQTPYVFDADNKQCVACGHYLHDGTE